MAVKKKPITVYFTDEILEAVKKAVKQSKTGENQNQTILNCIAKGLSVLYEIEV